MRERQEPSAAPPPGQPARSGRPGRPDRTSVPIRDEVALALAEFAIGVPRDPDPALIDAATRVVVDSLAVALGAFGHPAAAAARRYAGILPGDGPCALWGTNRRAGPETAALVNGVPLRGYDFNDLYMGRGTDGHPSDILPGLIAVAEWRGASGADFLDALAVGYEIILDCCDCLAVDRAGWDYVNLTAIGGTAAIARLIGLDAERTAHALGITVTAHAASVEVESGELDKRGDLTMWKRFNGADANRHSVYACLLASAGAEGAVRPFTGENGFLSRVNANAGGGAELLDRLRAKAGLGRIREVTFKRWPVGSRGQSAIRAALAARAQNDDPGKAKAVR
ncbi:MAG: MmgE/PrpD family protein, partial [Rhodospirillaceae bacterium]